MWRTVVTWYSWVMHGDSVTSRLPTSHRLHPRHWMSPRNRGDRPTRTDPATASLSDQSCSTDGAHPGSDGEHRLQIAYGTQQRAARFYADQFRDRLLPTMIEFIGRMELVFIATSDRHGECDSSLRAGEPGFIRVLDERTLAYPEYRGNGVMASLGNISDNPHIGLLMIDFVQDLIGLHVNGRARIVDDETFRALHPAFDRNGMDRDVAEGRRAERWVLIEITEAYIHCRKHIPRMQRLPQKRAWGTDDPARKGGDYFGARATARIPQPRTPIDSTVPRQASIE